MTDDEVRATIPMPSQLRDRIKSLGRVEGRPFNKQALKMLETETDRSEKLLARKRDLRR